jgi:hypothetical protein
MNLDALAVRLSDATLRVEQCFPLFGCLNGGEAYLSQLDDFVLEMDDEDLARLWPDVAKTLDSEANVDEVIGALVEMKKNGWLVQMATPVMRPDATGATFSWGNYYTHWLYAESMEDIVAQAEVWAVARRKSERAKAGLPEEVAG